MTKEQIEQAAKAAGKKYRETHLSQYNSRYQEHGENDYAKGFEQGATSPEAAAYHEGEKDEAIRELVVSLNDIIMQHVTANFKTKEDQSEYNASLRRARLLITKYSKK